MRVRRGCTMLAMLGCVGLLQCTAPQPLPEHSAFDGAPNSIRAIEPQFRDGLGRLTSLRPWPTFDGPVDFDWVLLGVRVQWDGQERVWFVRVAEVLDFEEAQGGRALRDRRFIYTAQFGVGAIPPDARFTVRCRRIRVETYDERGEFIAAWSRLSPEVFPGASLYRSLASLPQRGPLPPLDAGEPESHRAMTSYDATTVRAECDRGVYRLIATLQTLGTTPPLAEIRDVVRQHIVATPSIVALLMTVLKPTIAAQPMLAESVVFPWLFEPAAMPCKQSDFTVRLAGEPFLECRVAASPSEPPIDLLGGLLAIEAVHPTLPNNRLTVRVLAASASP